MLQRRGIARRSSIRTAADMPGRLLGRAAARVIEAVRTRIFDAVVQRGEFFRFLQYKTAIVGNATPGPHPGSRGLVEPRGCKLPTHPADSFVAPTSGGVCYAARKPVAKFSYPRCDGGMYRKPLRCASVTASFSDWKNRFDLATIEPSRDRHCQSHGLPGTSLLLQRNSHSTATALLGNGSIACC
jgi:hypothetical protein